MATWAVLTNHALTLSFLANHPSITARELAHQIGITERSVRKIIAALESEGYIAKAKGRQGSTIFCSAKVTLPPQNAPRQRGRRNVENPRLGGENSFEEIFD